MCVSVCQCVYPWDVCVCMYIYVWMPLCIHVEYVKQTLASLIFGSGARERSELEVKIQGSVVIEAMRLSNGNERRDPKIEC